MHSCQHTFPLTDISASLRELCWANSSQVNFFPAPIRAPAEGRLLPAQGGLDESAGARGRGFVRPAEGWRGKLLHLLGISPSSLTRSASLRSV